MLALRATGFLSHTPMGAPQVRFSSVHLYLVCIYLFDSVPRGWQLQRARYLQRGGVYLQHWVHRIGLRHRCRFFSQLTVLPYSHSFQLFVPVEERAVVTEHAVPVSVHATLDIVEATAQLVLLHSPIMRPDEQDLTKRNEQRALYQRRGLARTRLAVAAHRASAAV
jgi:hypothetical protein